MNTFWIVMLALGIVSLGLIAGAFLRAMDQDPPDIPWENK